MSTLPDIPNTPRRPDARPQFPNAARILAEMRGERQPEPIDEIAREILSEGMLAADEWPTEHALAKAVLDRGDTIAQLRSHAAAALKANTEAREAFTSLAKVATEQCEQIKRLSLDRARLESAIRKHRDERGHDRCWLDDAELYAVLGEPQPDTSLPPEAEFIDNCRRFHALRQAPKGTTAFGDQRCNYDTSPEGLGDERSKADCEARGQDEFPTKLGSFPKFPKAST